MRVTTRSAFASVAVLFALLVASPVLAVSNRIFMSTNGNNAGDCANPLTPCLTFAGALAQVNAGGEVIAEATGGYGPLNITQAVTISGPPGVVIYSGLQVNVNAPGATVVLRGLTIDGTGATGNGISVVSVGTLFVESCVITGFVGSGSTGNGVYFASAGSLSVKDTIARLNANVGIEVGPSTGTAKASVEHCRLDGNGSGLNTDQNAVTTVRNSVASGNSTAGFSTGSGGELNMENCIAANNGTGVSSAGTIRVSDSTVTDNVVGLFFTDSNIFTRGNNTVEGNGSGEAFNGTYSAK